MVSEDGPQETGPRGNLTEEEVYVSQQPPPETTVSDTAEESQTQRGIPQGGQIHGEQEQGGKSPGEESPGERVPGGNAQEGQENGGREEGGKIPGLEEPLGKERGEKTRHGQELPGHGQGEKAREREPAERQKEGGKNREHGRQEQGGKTREGQKNRSKGPGRQNPMGVPGSGGGRPGPGPFLQGFIIPPKPDPFSDHPCKTVNCGEAGCLIHNETKLPTCICTESWTPPDENNRCPVILRNPLFPPHLIDASPPTLRPARNTTIGLSLFEKNETSSMPLMSKMALENVHLQVIKIAVPVVGGLALILTIAIFLLRRRRTIYNRPPISESPITWLHRQDSLILLDHLTVVSKNPNYYTPDLEAPSLANLRTKLIPRDHLNLLEEIGEGAFGKVFKGEVAWSRESVSLVAVKVLKEGASRETREDFKREVEIMSAFDHENILKLIGVVAIEEDSPYMIFEYMEYGDLADLLRKNDPVHGREKTLDLKQTDLIDIATQIANGMMYLTSQHFVHRDLATRNCLVGGELVVKISDFGMSRDIYTCDYYRIGGSRMLPVRWMSPESVKYGRFTSESDVWAYGVVLWEIFSYGKQPYYGHTNEEVIRFIEDGILLQKPDGCPSTIYHVMLGCWRSDPKDRFNFERIHRHLVEYGRKMVRCYHQLQNNDDAEYEDI